MAFMAGSIYAKAELDSSSFEKNAKSMGTSIKGMTSSMVGAQAIIAVASKAIQGLTNIVKDSVKAFIVQEKVETQLNAVLKSTQHAAGLTAKEIKNMAASLQGVTTFGDEAIIAGQNMLLTFTKIGKDVFPGATEAMLDMAEAMGTDLKTTAMQVGKALNDPIKGVTSLSRAGVQFTEDQKGMINQMVKTGDVAGAQKMILKELETQFGGSAKAARDTFGGALKSLKNTQGDLMEIGGSMVSVFGRDIVEGMNKSTKGIINFIQSAKGSEKIAEFMGKVGAAFSVLEDIFKVAVDGWMKAVQGWFESTKKTIEKIVKPTEDTGKAFKTLAVFAMSLNLAFQIMAKVSSLLINISFGMAKTFWNLGRVVWETAKIIGDFFSGKEVDTDGLKKAIKKTADDFADLGTQFADGVKDIASTFIDGVKDIQKNSDKMAEDMQKKAEENSKKMREKTLLGLRMQSNDKETEDKKQEQSDKSKWSTFVENAKAGAEKMKSVVDKIAQYFNAGLDIVKTAFSGITKTLNMFWNEELKQLEHQNAKKIKAMTEQHEKENAELLNRNQQQLNNLDQLHQRGRISDEEYKLRKEMLQQSHDTNTEAQKTSHDQAMFELEQEAKRKENEQKKKAFENNKAFSIAQVWIDAAAAIMGFWAAYASIPIAGPIIAGILSGVATGVAIAQTVAISQQQFVPALATGGMVGNARQVRINEEGGEIVTLPDGSQVIPHDISRQIAKGVSGAGQNINVSFAGAQISDNMSLQKIADHVIRKMGRELRLT